MIGGLDVPIPLKSSLKKRLDAMTYEDQLEALAQLDLYRGLVGAIMGGLPPVAVGQVREAIKMIEHPPKE